VHEAPRVALDAAQARLLPRVEAALQEALERYAARFPRGPAQADYYGMMGYHLGWLDERLAPAAAPTGKRLRPLICLLAAEACGGAAAGAMPAAVALELLHNFTLIHDDVEDGDAVRHHRPTVWRRWGVPLAINAGDGMHVLAYLALLELGERDVPAAVVRRLAVRLAETSLAITEGQHLDLVFEQRDDVAPDEYLDMIARKSAALLRCAAAMGAEAVGSRQYAVGSGDHAGEGAAAAYVEALAGYGHHLGMGFQVRDDVLGIWGDADTTGKPAGDLRRRKKTLPSLYALAHADAAGGQALRALFAAPDPDDEHVARALAALERAGARRHCEQIVAGYSAAARRHLAALPPSEARAALDCLADQLETRER
jgi:geranylgeranyl diphosphate synthase type I